MCKRKRKDDILPIFDVDENQKVKQLFNNLNWDSVLYLETFPI